MTITAELLDKLAAAATAADKVAPGGWLDDSMPDWPDDRQVVCADGPVCDTLNSHFAFSPDDRRALMLHVGLADPPTIMALVELARKGLAPQPQPASYRAFVLCDMHGGQVRYDNVKTRPVPEGVELRHGTSDSDIPAIRPRPTHLFLCAGCAAVFDTDFAG
jgi:hypothetical protein